MPKIVVMGVAGSGKSSLAERLGARLGCESVEGDDYHLPSSTEKMRRGIPLEDADREPWLARIGELISGHDGDIVVTCSALKRSYRDLIRAHVPELRFVFIEIDVHTAAKRVGGRSGHLFPMSLVTSQFVALESPAGEPGVCEVSALWPLEAQVDAVCRWLTVAPAEVADTRSVN